MTLLTRRENKKNANAFKRFPNAFERVWVFSLFPFSTGRSHNRIPWVLGAHVHFRISWQARLFKDWRNSSRIPGNKRHEYARKHTKISRLALKSAIWIFLVEKPFHIQKKIGSKLQLRLGLGQAGKPHQGANPINVYECILQLYHNSNTTYQTLNSQRFPNDYMWMSEIRISDIMWPWFGMKVCFNLQENWLNL